MTEDHWCEALASAGSVEEADRMLLEMTDEDWLEEDLALFIRRKVVPMLPKDFRSGGVGFRNLSKNEWRYWLDFVRGWSDRWEGDRPCR